MYNNNQGFGYIMKRRVRITRLVLLLSGLVLLSIGSSSATFLGDVNTSLNESQALDAKSSPGIRKAAAMANQQYVPHAPIKITSNADFKALGFPGEGTQSVPYVIEDLNITSSTQDLIAIQETTKYFSIQNNL